MPGKFRGVMQSPVTPLKDDFSLDLPTFERLLDFHVRTGRFDSKALEVLARSFVEMGSLPQAPDMRTLAGAA